MVASMFERLTPFDKILVTGPQRSGTRIAAIMIAHDLSHEYIDEVTIHTDSLYSLAILLQEPGKIVVQCPALCRDIHYFGNRNDVATVLVVRDLAAIRASQDRVGWTESWEPLELARYDHYDGPIAARKYAHWYGYQKDRIRHSFELDYDSLNTHPLWIPKEQRTDFGFTQTEPEGEAIEA